MSISADNITPQHSNLSKTFSSILCEERERDKRRLNLILHNIPESTNSNNDVRKQDDIDTAATIFNQHLGIPTSVSNATGLERKALKQGFYELLYLLSGTRQLFYETVQKLDL